MKRGVWHQCGDRSQKLAADQLEAGVGVGVIISPRDLAMHKAKEYSESYRSLGADVLFDSQFCVPDAILGKLDSYFSARHRKAISELHKISDRDLDDLSTKIHDISQELGVAAVVAPAVPYDAGRPDITGVNRSLFAAAKSAARTLQLPVYATAVFGRSTTQTDVSLNDAISAATSLNADGWYFAFEFAEERLPTSRNEVSRCCLAGLRLASTGKPVLHAFAGPPGLLSPAFGATAVGIGHNQNLWKFTRTRWEEATGQGGGGDAPARHFSIPLWGTIIDPDELALLTPELRNAVVSDSPFRKPWDRWQANKHLVHCLGSTLTELFKERAFGKLKKRAVKHLDGSVALHRRIADEGIELKDDTYAYQANWRWAIHNLHENRADDFDYLSLLLE